MLSEYQPHYNYFMKYCTWLELIGIFILKDNKCAKLWSHLRECESANQQNGQHLLDLKNYKFSTKQVQKNYKNDVIYNNPPLVLGPDCSIYASSAHESLALDRNNFQLSMINDENNESKGQHGREALYLFLFLNLCLSNALYKLLLAHCV